MSDTTPLADVQGQADSRGLAIKQVGIKDLRYPIQFADRDGVISTVAHCAFSVYLAPEHKGTHMSRFIQQLEQQTEPFSLSMLPSYLASMRDKLNTERACIELAFPFFVKKTAPVTKIQSYLDYDITLKASQTADDFHYHLGLRIPITSLCPASKSISDYGAHNQRSYVQVQCRCSQPIWLTDIIEAIESQGSAELFALLKRQDEKYVTEHAYDHPKFVEDLVRDIAGALQDLDAIDSFQVSCENLESIHNHTAFAVIEQRHGQ